MIMLMRREIKDKNNMTIGWCEDYSDRIIATHYRKGYVGYYAKGATDTTFDDKGRIYSRGDATSSLIRDAERE